MNVWTDGQADRQNLQISSVCGARSGSPQLTLVDIELAVATYMVWMFHLAIKQFVKWLNEIHTLIHLINIPEPVEYHIYALDFLFDLRCESANNLSVICIHMVDFHRS